VLSAASTRIKFRANSSSDVTNSPSSTWPNSKHYITRECPKESTSSAKVFTAWSILVQRQSASALVLCTPSGLSRGQLVILGRKSSLIHSRTQICRNVRSVAAR
jgi:hypothetical protein